MRVYYLVGLLVASAAIGILLSTFSNASSYVNFAQAEQTQANVHIIGTLVKDAQGTVQGVQTHAQHQAFSFLLQDNQGGIRRIHYAYPMPSDFLRADKVVIVGKATSGHFVADKILLKCPSKYEENTLSQAL